MTLQLPTQTEAADQRLTAAVRDAVEIIRDGKPYAADADVAAIPHDVAVAILNAAGTSADRILGHTCRHYAQTFRVGRP